jgi:TonB family protein
LFKSFNLNPNLRSAILCVGIALTGLSLLVGYAAAQTPPKIVTKTEKELRENIKEWHEPEYPPIARQARYGGQAEVELTIDEQGDVISARMISGYPLLRLVVLKAAQALKFKPMTVNKIPVKVTGRITYTFPIDEPTYFGKTIPELEKEIREKPESADAHYELGVAYFDALHYPEAIVQLTEAMRLDPKHAEAQLKLGHAYMKIYSFDQALIAYTKAIQLDPNNSESLHALGLTYMGLGKYEDAITSFEKSLQVEGPIVSSYFMIGKCYVFLDRPAEATAYYKKGLARDPESDAGHFGLGEAYLMLGQYSEAITEFKETIRLSEGPGMSVTRYHLGLAYIRSGDRESALKEYEILKKLNEELAKRLLEEIKRSSKGTV